MPIEIVELGKLMVAILLFIIPGYLWSFFFFQHISRLERIVFGFVLTMSMFILAYFILDLILNIPLTRTKTLIIYGIYTGSIIILYLISILKKGIPDSSKHLFHITSNLVTNPIPTIKKHKTIQILILLAAILAFAAYMGFLPHLKENYYLPFHVDEWIHWTRTKSMMETGFTSFTNPWLGTGLDRSLEPGFNYMVGSIAWLTNANFNTIFLFSPAIFTMLASLAAFNLGNNHKKSFGLEAALCIAVIPTTCRMMGPSFFVPVATGLFFLVFLLWFLQVKKPLLLTPLVPMGLWVIFLIHPPTALAAMIITFFYASLIFFEKQFKNSILHFIYACIPIGGAFALSSRYGASIQQVIDAFFGGKYFLGYNLPQIWVSFEHMGIIIWGLAVIGVYFAFNHGKSIIRTIGLSALSFLIIIGLYDKFGYGLPIMYERSFMFLFLMICLLAGWGLAELRRSITQINISQWIKHKDTAKKTKHIQQLMGTSIPFIIFFLLVFTTVPAHKDILYYKMINETDYESFTWIENNIDTYRNNSNILDKATVDPFKACPFSSITRLSIVSSTMHPIPGYKYHQDVENFLSGCCTDEGFLDDFNVDIVYTTGCCTNANLTMIHSNVYIFP